MNKLNITAIAAAIALAFSAGAMAQSVSKDDYLSVKDKIAADYKLAKASCDLLSGNPNDICMAGARGNEKVALAELEAGYKPTPETRYQARVARADPEYELAKERCDDRAGNTKDVCMKEAMSAEIAAKAACASLSGNAKDICNAEATGKEKVAKAELEAEYKPSHDASYKVRVAQDCR